MLALRFGDILRIEVAQLLRGGRRSARAAAGKQKEFYASATPLPFRRRNKRGEFERRMTGRVPERSADGEKLGAALREQLVGSELPQPVEFLDERALERADRGFGVAMCAA